MNFIIYAHINDIDDTQTCKIYFDFTFANYRLLPFIYDQLTGDKIFAGAQF